MGGIFVVAACLAGMLAGCGNPFEPPASAPSSTSSGRSPNAPSPNPSDTGPWLPDSFPSGLSTGRPDLPELLDDGTTLPPRTERTLVLDDPARASAIERGRKVMELYARRTVSAERWRSELVPYLTTNAALQYTSVDPLNGVPIKFTGPVTLTPDSVPMVAWVSVPTDGGEYLVVMARTPENPIWYADQIKPPEIVGD